MKIAIKVHNPYTISESSEVTSFIYVPGSSI